MKQQNNKIEWQKDFEISLENLNKIREVVEKQLKDKNLGGLGKDNFQELILESVYDWQRKKKENPLWDKEKFPPIGYSQEGKIIFHKEILEDLKDICKDKVGYIELLAALMMHERLHCSLGHLGGENYAEGEVNTIMSLFAPGLIRIWENYRMGLDKIEQRYSI